MTASVSASRVARAEVRYQHAQRKEEAAETERGLRYARENRRSEERAQAERMQIESQWRELRDALAWFRREWTGALPRTLHRSASHVEPGDVQGAPELTDPWRAYIARVDGAERDPDPIRAAIRSMVTGPNRYDRVGARYLFALACADFDPVKAGQEMHGVCVCLSREEHDGSPAEGIRPAPCPTLPLSDEYSPWYTVQAIERLRQVVSRRAKRRPGVVISESQAIAEAAA